MAKICMRLKKIGFALILLSMSIFPSCGKGIDILLDSPLQKTAPLLSNGNQAVANNSPVIAAFSANMTDPHPGQSVTLTVDASDQDGDGLNYAYAFNPGSGTISGSGASIVATVDNLSSNTITVTVTDGKGGQATKTLDLTGANGSPTISSFTAAAGNIFNTGTDTKTFAVAATDPDGDTLSYSYNVLSGLGSATGNTAASGTFTTGTSGGMSTVRVTVRDPYGGEATMDKQVKVCGWKLLSSVSGPTARGGHSAVYDGNGNMIVFGGNDTSLKNDLWSYNIAGQTWANIIPSSSPPGRERHSAIYYNGKMVICGGLNDIFGSHKDVWEYDITGQTWTQGTQYPSSSSYGPIEHSAIYDGTNMIVFGGLVFGSGGPNRQVYKYTVSAVPPTWTLDSSTDPAMRVFHSAIYVGSGNMIIFAGYANNSSYVNDVWKYNISGKTWTQQVYPIPGPAIRQAHSAIYYPSGTGYMIIFGGDNGSSYMNDVWSYDIVNMQWSPLVTQNGPLARSRHTTIYDGNGNMIVFGGSSPGNYNDLWMYVLP